MSALGGTWRSLWRFHRLLAGILVLEYALTFAIFLITSGVLISRVMAISETSGVEERGLYVVQGTGINQPVHRSELLGARTRFQALVGRKRVAVGSSVPYFGVSAMEMPISAPDDRMLPAPLEANAYEGGIYFPSVLGVRLLRGRTFQEDEVALRYGDATHVTILSETLARRLFHGEDAVGKQVKIGSQMHTVVGVINPLAAPKYLGGRRTTYTFLLPKIATSGNLLLIRYGGPVADLKNVLDALRKHDEGKVHWSLLPYAAIRGFYFRSDRLTVAALAVVMCIVLVTALCGILGLTNYWVSRRRHQIAIRRALGAKKRDIIVHFLGESSLLMMSGLVLSLAFGLFSSAFVTDFHTEAGVATWSLSIVLILLLATAVVYASLRRWLRMDPAELMRSI